MYENKKIGLLGGDLRQASLAKKLATIGFETAIWGMGSMCYHAGDAVQCVDYVDAINRSEAVILPLPATTDGRTINCPFISSDNALDIYSILEDMDEGKLILGGKLPEKFIQCAKDRNIKAIDYFESEELQIRNAIPTAEGALAIALDKLPITMHGACVAIVGYGRISKVLSRMLKALGANVTVFARKSSDITWIELERLNSVQILPENNNIQKLCNGFDCIFNTVPQCIIGKEILTKMEKSTLIIDLASAPGGVDFECAKEEKINVIWALSLPGKVAPTTAGEIISDCVVSILRSQGVITE